MTSAQIMGDLKTPTPGGAGSSRSISKTERSLISAFWYLVNAGGVALLYVSRLLG